MRAVAVTGADERSFSAGMHKERFTGAHPSRGRVLIAAISRALHAVRTYPDPTVATVNGYCPGAAFELVLSSDLRVAHR